MQREAAGKGGRQWKGAVRPYLPELTIRDYNTYLWYLRGVRWQMSRSYGFYSCRLLQHNGVLVALRRDR